MSPSRNLLSRLSRIAQLQELRTLATQGKLSRAQTRSNIARVARDRADAALVDRVAELERLTSSETLDIAALAIARAVLATLTRERDVAAAAHEDRQEKEEQRRRNWKINRNLETHAFRLHRKAGRRVAQKREDTASLELTLLRQIHAKGTQP